jgi:hypothetical protein
MSEQWVYLADISDWTALLKRLGDPRVIHAPTEYPVMTKVITVASRSRIEGYFIYPDRNNVTKLNGRLRDGKGRGGGDGPSGNTPRRG